MADTHVTITGNLTDDPELRFTPNGTAVANFRLAVTARVKDGDSWRDGDTSFFRINVWRQLAEHVAESLSKGDRVDGHRPAQVPRPGRPPRATSARWSRSRPTRSPPRLRWATAKPERAANGSKGKGGSSTTSPPF